MKCEHGDSFKRHHFIYSLLPTPCAPFFCPWLKQHTLEVGIQNCQINFTEANKNPAHKTHKTSCTYWLCSCSTVRHSRWTRRSRCCWPQGSCPHTGHNSGKIKYQNLAYITTFSPSYPRTMFLKAVTVGLNNLATVRVRVNTWLAGRQGRALEAINLNQLEKLEAAKAAYLWLPLVTFPYLTLPFLTFPYLSLPFLTLGLT